MENRAEKTQQILDALSGLTYRDAKSLLMEILEERIQDSSVICPAAPKSDPGSGVWHSNT